MKRRERTTHPQPKRVLQHNRPKADATSSLNPCQAHGSQLRLPLRPDLLKSDMPTFIDAVPVADVLLALQPQELGEVLLQLAQDNGRHHQLHRTEVLAWTRPPTGSPQQGYPEHRRGEIELAVLEAFHWLTVQGMLIHEDGNTGWCRVSRLGQRLMRDLAAFADYTRAAAFPKALLHPAIADEVWLDLVRGDLAIAVLRSFRAVEIAVRDVGRFRDEDIGVPLMRRAFGQGGPLADPARMPAETDALANLFAGALGSYKNPHSHRTVEIRDLTEAQEMVLLASHLLRIVDSRR
jgi:hypothetical protein